MPNKIDIQEYIISVLQKLDCNGIKVYPTGNIHAQCPFHKPRRNITAFGVSYVAENKGYPYNCQSCGENGNLVQLVSYADGVSYKRALKRIGKNVGLPPVTMAKLTDGLLRLKELSQTASAGIGVVALPPRCKNQNPMVKYLTKRKRRTREVLDIDYIINKYGLYYCNDGWYAGRIIMPIRIGGEVVGINDRSIDDSAQNKSLHVKGEKFGRLLHGLDEITSRKTGVLVEGSFDMYQVVSALKGTQHAKEFGVVCNIGTSFSEQKAALLVESFDELVIMFDNDLPNEQGKRTGPDAAEKVEYMMKEFMPVRNVTEEYPRGKDPGICTAKEILTALYAKGRTRSTNGLSKLKRGTRLNI